MNYSFDTNTFKFKDLIPDFNAFKTLSNMYIPDVVEATEIEQSKIFRLLYNNFCNCSVAYDTPSSFYRHFMNEYGNYCDDYIRKLDLIKKIRNMPIDELSKEVKSISNIAHNDNSIVDNPLRQIIPYISTQTSSISSSNELLAIHRAVSLFRDNESNIFLDRFKKFFIIIHGDKMAYYLDKEC